MDDRPFAQAAPRFVFASDSFKGTLSSADTARLLEEAARRHFPGCSCAAVPMADGGEGTADALVFACGGTLRHIRAQDPLGRPVDAAWADLGGGRAVVEAASASGLTLLGPDERDPLAASSYGTGQLVLAALEAGARDVTVALGGSATNDGGMGFLRALGVRFLDGSGSELAGTGADLGRVRTVDLSGVSPLVSRARFTAMCDVDNPLLGLQGATRVFGPQKGAGPEALGLLESGMENYAACAERALGRPVDVPGAGAAGGLGAACQAFLAARMQSGVERVLELAGFPELVSGAALCVTGEGHLDAQTSHGKVVAGVAAACARSGVPCVAVVGGADADATGIPGLGAVVPCAIDAMPIEEALRRAEELYRLAADRLFSILAIAAGV